jgi:hypothetical protein
LGVTVAEHADQPGDFTQILYFTSEQEARSYDQDPAIEDDEPAQMERRRLLTSLRCFDLRDPQLLSPSDTPTY